MAGFRHVTISQPVGWGGRNLRADVEHVQELLNICPARAHRRLLVDGRCGPRTTAAIAAVERHFLHVAHPDERLDPNGPTLRALNFYMRDTAPGTSHAPSPRQAPPVAPQAMAPHPASAHPTARMATPPAAQRSSPPAPAPAGPGGSAVGAQANEITAAAGAAAQTAQRRWGVPASVTLAQ